MNRSAFAHTLSLKFSGLESAEDSLIVEALMAYPGVSAAKIKPAKSQIQFRYEVQLTNLNELIELLQALGVKPYTKGLWWKWRWHLAKQIEQNIQANVAHVPHCCGKAPISARRR
ncbi:hypothetical protein MAQ5080_01961 [Marinomonas aquimarina]|uniref:HMA domain-containing protein n=1 Tax=Marinomonas aquimarina TaxID=295068 RepID=A0A1A8TFT7_9GAMM|nr:cation transporter [Marinomonas aquimarina]SBS31403.1 hypothetical protein MAQ5080_01961 [Marinomonas aquimarina]